MTDILIFDDTDKLAQAAAAGLIEDLRTAIDGQGSATWVLAGGRVPLLAYRLIARDSREALDWTKVNIVIGDERCVPFDDPESSWSQAEAILLRHLDLAPTVRRPQTERSAEEAADDYETYLLDLPQTDDHHPRFDHIWLGVGEDGHTLSLFPDHPSMHPTEELVIAVHDSPKPPPDRITLTLKALQGVRHCTVIAAGEGKADIIRRAMEADQDLPIARAVAAIEESGGRVTWLLDEAAASLMEARGEDCNKPYMI